MAPGTYAVDDALELARRRRPAGRSPGEPAPLLVADEDLDDESSGAPARCATSTSAACAPGRTAVELTGGLGEDLDDRSPTGDGVKLVGNADDVTLLRDSVVQSASDSGVRMADGGIAELRRGLLAPGPGDVALRNVTAIAPPATRSAARLDLGQQATLVNVIARGAARTSTRNGGDGCSASYSNLRPGSLERRRSARASRPASRSSSTGGVRPLAASPTVDAGVADALTTAADPDGRERTVPDIGAYECCAAGDPAGRSDQPSRHAQAERARRPSPRRRADRRSRASPPPVLGSDRRRRPRHGRVPRPPVPGGRFRSSTRPTLLPSRHRRRRHRRADHARHRARRGRPQFQTGRFWGGRFQIRQGRQARGMTSLQLRGGDFGAACRRERHALASGVAARTRQAPRRARLWARDHGGRFRTHGHNSVATARGTAWVTRDRCDGTVTRVREDAVVGAATGAPAHRARPRRRRKYLAKR